MGAKAEPLNKGLICLNGVQPDLGGLEVVEKLRVENLPDPRVK